MFNVSQIFLYRNVNIQKIHTIYEKKTLSGIIDGIPILYLVADNFCSSVNTEQKQVSNRFVSVINSGS